MRWGEGEGGQHSNCLIQGNRAAPTPMPTADMRLPAPQEEPWLGRSALSWEPSVQLLGRNGQIAVRLVQGPTTPTPPPPLPLGIHPTMTLARSAQFC